MLPYICGSQALCRHTKLYTYRWHESRDKIVQGQRELTGGGREDREIEGDMLEVHYILENYLK